MALNGPYVPRLELGTIVVLDGGYYKVIGRNGFNIHLRRDDGYLATDFWTTIDRVRRL